MQRPLEKTGTPDVKKDRSFLEIVENFTDPKEVVREAISNALDWGANSIRITVFEDVRRGNELVIEIRDNGLGLTRERFEAFWNLADSPGLEHDQFGKKVGNRTGEKGHGTKTYWKCRELEVESATRAVGENGWHVIASMKEPINTLRQRCIPDYEYADDTAQVDESFTKVTIRGYQSHSKEEFRHEVLLDYIRWFTKFGSIELELDQDHHRDKLLLLQGLGRTNHESIPFGHLFPPIADNISALRREHQDDWPKYYVKKWVFPRMTIPGYPSSTFDLVFYLEGDSAKLYNPMLRRRGRRRERWHYTVSERYGLYVCKDWIPLPPSQRVNEWISEKSEWTLYHAFVNCQDFQLTANRASIGNTERDFFMKVSEAVAGVFKDQIQASEEYRAYEEEIDSTKHRATADATLEQERTDRDKRYDLARRKRIADYKPKELSSIVLSEPREEVEVAMLFSIVSSLEPQLFEFHILDYSTHRGFDALCTLEPLHGSLQRGDLRYVEFKRALTRDLGDHTFANLAAIVCWECNLSDGAVIRDLSGMERTLKITESPGEPRVFMLVPPAHLAVPNIKVYVLKDFLERKLILQFRPRSTSR